MPRIRRPLSTTEGGRRPTTALPAHVRRRRTAPRLVGSGVMTVATCLPMFKTIGPLGAEIS
jgi:hypothetical protein